jgi:hypothetical protein
VGPQTGTAYTGSPTSCAAVGAAYAAFSFYTLGALVQPPDPSQYVEATVQTQQ